MAIDPEIAEAMRKLERVTQHARSRPGGRVANDLYHAAMTCHATVADVMDWSGHNHPEARQEAANACAVAGDVLERVCHEHDLANAVNGYAAKIRNLVPGSDAG